MKREKWVVKWKGMLRRGRWLTLSFFIFHSSFFTKGLAQPPSEGDLRRYRAAVQAVARADYARAITDLVPLTRQSGSLAPYAHYYTALAHFRQKNFVQCRAWLRQLQERYPDWQRNEDVQYLLACAQFETGQYDDALTALRSVQAPALRSDGEKATQFFVAKITDLAQLRELQRQHPDNRAVAHALIALIQKQSTDRADLELSDRLTNRFGVPGGSATVPASTVPNTSSGSRSADAVPSAQPQRPARAAGGALNVAVMLPFRLDEIDPRGRQRPNQYVYDLYEGMKMARQKLAAEGINANIQAYDVANDADRTAELMASPAFALNTLIIGPLFAEPNRLATAWAARNNVALVNPVSTNAELVANQPAAFLAQPSLLQQAEQAFEFMRTAGGAKRVAVLFGAARRDSLLAVAYRDAAQKGGWAVTEFRRASAVAANVAKLTETAGANRPARFGHVLLASGSANDGPRVLSALERAKFGGAFIATSGAFALNRVSGDAFSGRSVYLIAPEFLDAARPAVQQFQQEYLARANLIPSAFVAQGYDMMLFFGRALARQAFPFTSRAFLSTTDTADDYLLTGFDYLQSNDNRAVTIVKVEEGRLIKVN